MESLKDSAALQTNFIIIICQNQTYALALTYYYSITIEQLLGSGHVYNLENNRCFMLKIYVASLSSMFLMPQSRLLNALLSLKSDRTRKKEIAHGTTWERVQKSPIRQYTERDLIKHEDCPHSLIEVYLKQCHIKCEV